ncbi:hypothetical protein QJS10_CPA01g00570 [Acorus calamus]|uniref:3-hydroxyisobutyrate dehydrogenase n=1 Tax=Acorus calamus TaxID=4465 RepID=A0AAV9FLB4_ACOCL|nr:hypothetical protein QJS10_CPA01g00570 [Acorus calamus]
MAKFGSTHPIRRFCSTPVPSHIGKVGFIGLGNMGSHMANNLIDAGFDIAVHDMYEICHSFQAFIYLFIFEKLRDFFFSFYKVP